MKIKFNLEDVNFAVRGKENDAFGNEKIDADLQGHIGKLSIEVESSLEEMVKEVVPYLKDAIKASIEKK